MAECNFCGYGMRSYYDCNPCDDGFIYDVSQVCTNDECPTKTTCCPNCDDYLNFEGGQNDDLDNPANWYCGCQEVAA